MVDTLLVDAIVSTILSYTSYAYLYTGTPNFKTVNSGKRWKTLHSDVFSRGSLNTFASIFPGFHSSTRGGFRDPPF